MARPPFWIIEDFEYKPYRPAAGRLRAAVALHSHSYHSEENLGALNDIMALPVLNKVNKVFCRAFRAKAKDELDYADLYYCPPISPEQVYQLELEAALKLGFERLLIAVTDHDKVASGPELIQARPELEPSIGVGEELSIWFQDQVLHLGVLGLPAAGAAEAHKEIQSLAKRGELDDLFHYLWEQNCAVVFNHPYYKMRRVADHDAVVEAFVRGYGSMIHAVEFNGLRPREENERVFTIAYDLGVPLVGGGDRHSPLPSLTLTASRDAETFTEFLEELKRGEVVTVCTNDFFRPHGLKLLVRILFYVSAYRRITFFRRKPITSYSIDDRILPDYFAATASFLLKVLGALGLVR